MAENETWFSAAFLKANDTSQRNAQTYSLIVYLIATFNYIIFNRVIKVCSEDTSRRKMCRYNDHGRTIKRGMSLT